MFGGRGIGAPELLIVLLIVLLIFGASKLPQLGEALGKGIRSFKKGVTEDDVTKEKEKETAKAADPTVASKTTEKP